MMWAPEPASFFLLRSQEIANEALQNILVDIERSVLEVHVPMGDLEQMARAYNCEERKRELKDVLVAYAKYNTNIEYCQGLSYYAAFLLQFFTPEESFSMLCRTIHINNIERLFDKQLSLVSRVLSVHGRVLNLTLPERIRKNVLRICNGSHDYAAGWYLTLFSRLAPKIYARILDLFYAHGFSILFHVASALVEVGYCTYIQEKAEEPDEQTQILFKLAEFPIRENEFWLALDKNVRMLSVAVIRRMLWEEDASNNPPNGLQNEMQDQSSS